MKIDLAAYEGSKKFVQDHILKHGKKDPGFAIAMASSVSHVPAIVCNYWAGEILGWPDFIVENIKSLIEFYQYTEIKNKPENAPI